MRQLSVKFKEVLNLSKYLNFWKNIKNKLKLH